MWYALLILAALIYLVAGPKPLRVRVGRVVTGGMIAALVFLATGGVHPMGEDALAIVAVLNGIAPVVGFLLGRPILRYLETALR